MDDKTGCWRGLRRAEILTVVAAVAVLATGCDVVHVHFGGSGSAEPATYRAELAYAQCMRAADADTRTAMAYAFSEGGHNYLVAGGGVSVAAPLWAAVIALADQDASRDLGFVNPALYQIGRSASYHQAFHDVTTGSNTVTFPTQTITGYEGAPGWDPVTGWGSPNAQVLVPLLAATPAHDPADGTDRIGREQTAVMGPSGARKPTLLQCAACLDRRRQAASGQAE